MHIKSAPKHENIILYVDDLAKKAKAIIIAPKHPKQKNIVTTLIRFDIVCVDDS